MVGLALPFAVLSSLMPLGMLAVALLLRWIARGQEVLATAAGLITGFGLATLSLFLIANAQCSIPGRCYESSPGLPCRRVLPSSASR
jgi:hypothetical protein